MQTKDVRVNAPASPTCFALIPARGGSKGIPKKNLLPVAGRPLIAWTIDAVQKATSNLLCVVSTDSEEIADVADQLGALVVMRPPQLASDEAPTEPSLIHSLDVLALRGLEAPDVMLLQATSPVRLEGTLDRALATFRREGLDSLVGVVQTSPFVWLGPPSSPTPMYSVDRRPRRQDLTPKETAYRESGSLYITKTKALRESGNRISGTYGLFVMDSREGVDIDEIADVDEAERLLGSLR